LSEREGFARPLVSSKIRNVRSSTQSHNHRNAILLVALAALLFAAGTYAEPLRILYSPLCHQQEARSFAVGEGHQAVCSRCSGLYWGGVAGLFAALLLRQARIRESRPVWLVVVALPTLVDAAAHWLGLPSLSALPRFILALPLGIVAGLLLAAAVGDLELMIREKRTLVEETHG
jgi:uncharacterized membrane protein